MLVYKTTKADLKNKYGLYMKVSVIVVLVVLIAAFKFSPHKSVEVTDKKTSEGPITILQTPPTQQNTLPPDLPRPMQPVISDNAEIEDIVFEETVPDYTKQIGRPPDRHISHRIIEDDDEYIFLASEEMPEPIGGMAEIQKKVRYTEFSRKIGIEGKVIIEAVVGKDGIVKDARVVVGLIEDLDQISLEAVKSTMFKPGMQRDKPVNVKIGIPIIFKLR